MTKLTVSLFLLCSMSFACGQAHVSNKNVSKQKERLSYDTSRIAILPIDTTNSLIFKDVASTKLTNQDLQITSGLLQKCLNVHNNKQDSTKAFSEYIDLKKYKLQYIPYVDTKGDKNIYVNGFCASNWGFDYWKQTLVQVEDGGSCFFHLTIDLTTKKYERLFTNGYG